jgi:hypothetical protein
MSFLSGRTSLTTVQTGDLAADAVTLAKMAAGTDGNIISFDTSGNPVAVSTGSDGQVLTSSGADTVCAFEDAAAGGIYLQVIQANFAETTTTTTTPASDSTIPLVAEGAEVVSQAITPSATSSRIEISIAAWVSGGGDMTMVFALFRDSTCIAAKAHSSRHAQSSITMGMAIVDSPATTSAVTYSLRFGVNGSTGYISQDSSGANLAGAVNITNGMILKEIAG